MKSVKIAGREFPLAFTLQTMIRMKKEIPDFQFDKMNELISDPEGMLAMLYQLMESGAKLEGKPLDVTKDWVAERIPPSMKKIAAVQIAISDALVEGMEMETEQADSESREVDVVLEEIKKKETSTN